MGSQLLCMLLENLILCLEWILGIFGFRIEPSTILFKGNLKSHIYEVKHKITKFLFFLIIKRLVFMLLLLENY